VALFAAACGGGGDDGAGTGARITDPGRVATATPLQVDKATTYQIKDGVVSSPAGSGTVTGGTGGSTAGQPQTHVVASGDTCAGIAERYGVSTDELLKANRFIDANCTNLRVDDPIRIPGVTVQATPRPGTTPTGGSGAKTYTVVGGDTCAAIAASFGVDVNALISLNGLGDCTGLKIDQVLRIP
jgi:LysM repeat protein